MCPKHTYCSHKIEHPFICKFLTTGLNKFSRMHRFFQDGQLFTTIYFNQLNGDSDVGDIVILVTQCWWRFWDVGGRILMLMTSLGCWRPKWPTSSPTFYCCHQHISSPTSVTNIDVTRSTSKTTFQAVEARWSEIESGRSKIIKVDGR